MHHMIGLEASSIETLFAYLSQCCSSSSLDALDLRKRQNTRVNAAGKFAVVAKSPAQLPSVSGPMPVLLTCSVLCIAIGEFVVNVNLVALITVLRLVV